MEQTTSSPLDPKSKDFMRQITSAALNGEVERVTAMVKLYDSYYSKINGKTILHKACEKGHTSLVRLLIAKYKCDLNARDTNGDTPFTRVGVGGSVECAELLINEFHCDINTKGFLGGTILHNACEKGHTSLVRLLITKYKCDLNAPDTNGDTPFTRVGDGGSVECAELLINEFHCDINTKYLSCITVFRKAYTKGHICLLKALVIKYGFNLNVLSQYKCPALNGGSQEIEKLKYVSNVKHLELIDLHKVCNIEEVESVIEKIGEFWHNFASFIGIKAFYLKELERLPHGQMNMIMNWWIHEDRSKFDYYMEPRWPTLVRAIEHPAGGNNALLANQIALSHLVPQGIPTLKWLTRFPCVVGGVRTNLNIIQRTSARYTKLAMFLLNDVNCDIVEGLEKQYHHHCEDIVTAIYKKWILGIGRKPTSWQTLVDVLREIEMNSLAEEMESVLKLR